MAVLEQQNQIDQEVPLIAKCCECSDSSEARNHPGIHGLSCGAAFSFIRLFVAGPSGFDPILIHWSDSVLRIWSCGREAAPNYRMSAWQVGPLMASARTADRLILDYGARTGQGREVHRYLARRRGCRLAWIIGVASGIRWMKWRLMTALRVSENITGAQLELTRSIGDQG